MYKALYLPAKEEIVILDAQWRGHIPFLRSLDQKDALICQGCLQPVRVRAGQFKRWHFAHKHLQNCPYEVESPALLAARAALYELLTRLCPPGSVAIEKRTEGAPRPFDCWVEMERSSFADWIISVRLSPEARQELQQASASLSAQVHWIFTGDMLRIDKLDGEAVHLTTTEREFMQPTAYDEDFRRHTTISGKTLHYLDTLQGSLITFRALQLQHAPQLYKGRPLRHLLSEIGIDLPGGELVHPGEAGRQEQVRQARASWESRLKMAADQVDQFSHGLQPVKAAPGIATQPVMSESASSRPEIDDPFSSREAICMYCGQLTRDWWYLDPKTGQCKCRSCLKGGMA